MKLKEFQCKECGELADKGSAHHKLCYRCNKERLNKGKAKKSSIVRKPIKSKRKKATGEKEMFIRIWAKRPHVCSNRKCGKQLGEPRVHFFSHIKPKSTHPHLRLEESNIELLCMDCHHEWEFGSKHKK